MRVLVTGGSGFIGSAVVRDLMANTEAQVLNVDKLTYAANQQNLSAVADDDRYEFCKLDICDKEGLKRAIFAFRPTAIVHLAAESHVDRSIDGPDAFIQTNLFGTYSLLEASRAYIDSLNLFEQESFRLVHVSTDEVFGSLGSDGLFDEATSYAPSSPYSATKAGSDHLARAWHKSFDVPIVVTNCSNNYGPYQFPEKLIPVVILSALAGQKIPVYGSGQNIRDWLHVEDHAAALRIVLNEGHPGETYTIGGNNEVSNLQIVETICDLIDERQTELKTGGNHNTSARDLIEFVQDRPGHDFRYAINAGKIQRETSWRPNYDLREGLKQTVDWYLDNESWWLPLTDQGANDRRLGLGRGGIK